MEDCLQMVPMDKAHPVEDYLVIIHPMVKDFFLVDPLVLLPPGLQEPPCLQGPEGPKVPHEPPAS